MSEATPNDAGTVLRSVQVNPVALSRAVVLATVMAKESGLTEAEREELSICISENHITVGFDVDGRTQTTTGEARLFSLRFKVPCEDHGGGAAVAAVRVHGPDTLRALRNRVAGSENAGVLNDSEPVELELRSNHDQKTAVTLVVRAAGKPERVIRVRGPVEVASFAVDAPRVISPYTGLSADSLIEMAGVTHPDVGLKLDGASATLVAAAPTSVAIASYRAGRRVDHTSGGGEAPQQLVISPRMATAAALAQLATEEVLRAEQRSVNARRMKSAVAASISASVDVVGPAARQVLASEVGEEVVGKARYGAKGSGEPQRAIAFARAVLAPLSEEQGTLLASLVAAPDATAGDAQLARVLAGGRPNEAAIAAAYLGAGHPEAFLRDIGHAVGRVRLGLASQEGPEVASGVVAEAAVSITGSADALGRKLRTMVPAEDAAAWWMRFGHHLAACGMPQDAIQALTSGERHVATPDSAQVVIPASMRERWVTDAIIAAQGQFSVDPSSGRAYAMLEAPGMGTVTVTDIAVEPRPDLFPMTQEEVNDAVARNQRASFGAELHSSDVQVAAGRIESLRSANRGALSTVFVLRWDPKNQEDGSDQSTSDAEIRSGTDILEVELEQAAASNSHGSLKVYGFDVSGERIRLTLPVCETSGPATEAGKPLAFALDAQRLQDLVAFVAQRGRRTRIAVAGDTVRVSDPQGRHVVVLPTVTASEIQPSLREAVAATGVEWAGKPLRQSEVFRRFSDHLAASEIRRVTEAQQGVASNGAGASVASRGAALIPSEVARETVEARLDLVRRKLEFWRAELERASGQRDLFGNVAHESAAARIRKMIESLEHEASRQTAVAASLQARRSEVPGQGVGDVRRA
jgi:hypothetical protein